MNNGIRLSSKYITSWPHHQLATFSSFASRVSQTGACTSGQPAACRTRRRLFWHAAQAHVGQSSPWRASAAQICLEASASRPQFTELVSRFWPGGHGPLGWWQVAVRRVQGKFSTSKLWIITQQKCRPLQAVLMSLAAAAGVPTALSVLPLFRPTNYSRCQPISPVYAASVVPVAILPRIRFYCRVAVRMVVLMAILAPLVILYPVGCWNSYARATWLNLLWLSLPWCGPAFTKWGQWASARGDLLPSDVREVLETLQNAAPAQPAASIKKTLQNSLPMPIDEAFSSIDWEPCGSGAIATVHRAVLTPEAAALCGFPAGQVKIPPLHCPASTGSTCKAS